MCCVVAAAGAGAEDEIAAARAQLEEQHAERLGALAEWCEEQRLEEAARRTRHWASPAPATERVVLILSDAETVVSLPDTRPGDGRSPEELEWRKRFSTARREQAEALFELGQQAMRADEAALAYELVVAAVRENPDHETGRRLLGYRRFRDAWHTPYEIRKMAAGEVWHEKFGWIREDHVERYEAGQRFYRRRWITAAEDARLHRNIARGWQVETEHFLVITNHSLEGGVALGRQLEHLYQAWYQAFPLYVTSEDELSKLFAGSGRSRRGRDQRFQVVYFADKEEYVAALERSQPNIGITTGIYFADARQAFFFAGDEFSRITLFHEATHQLFHQSRRVDERVGREANFWIIEGIACYMETLKKADGQWTLGGFDNTRIANARTYVADRIFYIPLEELCRLGMLDLQRHEQIRPIYSQSAGLAYFLMHYDGGRYRDALMAYLRAIYSGRDEPGTLAELAGVTFEELDRQYREFITQPLPQAASE